MKTLLVCAVREELEGLQSGLDTLYTGIGLENARKALNEALQKLPPDELRGLTVLNVGTTGSQNHERGSLISVNRAIAKVGAGFKSFEIDAWEPAVVTLGCHTGTCYSTDDFISPANIGELDAAPHHDCVDMEIYALADVCRHYRIPVRALKVVSDNLNGTFSDWKESLKTYRPALIEALEKLHTLKILA